MRVRDPFVFAKILTSKDRGLLGQEWVESCSFKHEKNSLPESKRHSCSDVSSFFRQNENFST